MRINTLSLEELERKPTNFWREHFMSQVCDEVEK